MAKDLFIWLTELSALNLFTWLSRSKWVEIGLNWVKLGEWV